jgi:hypothetical protein
MDLHHYYNQYYIDEGNDVLSRLQNNKSVIKNEREVNPIYFPSQSFLGLKPNYFFFLAAFLAVFLTAFLATFFADFAIAF